MELKDTIEGMISQDYKERFKAEYHQVRIRVEKLSKIIEDYEEHKLSFEPKCKLYVLVEQKLAMLKYLKILKDRALIEDIDLEE